MAMMKGVTLSKQLSITISDELWEQISEDMKKLQKYNTSQYIQKALQLHLDRDRFDQMLRTVQRETYEDLFKSEYCENWFSKMLDRELWKRSIESEAELPE